MDLKAFTAQLEAVEHELNLETYKQYAGLPYSDQVMRDRAARQQALAQEGLKRFPREALPPVLFLGLLNGKDAADHTQLSNEVYRLRNEEVAVDVAGERVNLNTVRRFNHQHLRDKGLRKQVFDTLMVKAKALTPVLERKFRLTLQAHEAHGLNPLEAYCLEEQVTEAQLVRLVDETARRARPEFERLAAKLTPEVLGKDRMEYYDDMYVYRHEIYSPFDHVFKDLDYTTQMKAVARRLGFAVDRVAIDGEPREGKYSSPVCFGVRIPGDVRILYQRTSPFGDYESFYHEMGHGLHFVSVQPDRPYWDRHLIPNGVAEIFSTLFEELALSPDFLQEEIGLSPETVAAVLERRKFMELYFLTFYGANSMHKVRFWSEKLTMDDADEAYEELTEKYMGVRYPGRYWQTHHILSMSTVYAPSYLLANIRKSEMIALLTRRFGRAWWRSPEAGAWIRDEAMGPGGALDLAAFSRLDPEPYLRTVFRA
ncbi:MAG TPA: M3 family metallopeptidase [Candidatus Thermoplasmatota archaeon]|nr:M3 family metallopeptidase [Candidatus Thermoplasmatota archaeon]